jgi:CHAD domain-containing protein
VDFREALESPTATDDRPSALDAAGGGIENRGLAPGLRELEQGACRGPGLGPSAGGSKPGRSLRGEDALLCLVYAHLEAQARSIQAHYAAVVDADPEGVHQMRIAVRRVRGVLRTFKRMLPDAERAQLGSDFGWLAGRLGQVRDLDVYRANYHRYLHGLPNAEAEVLERYRRHLDAEGRRAQAQLLRALDSARYRRLMDRFEMFVRRGPSAAAWREWGALSIDQGASECVRDGVRKILKRGRRLSGDSPSKALHRLRIDSKRFRYLLELFRDFDKRRTKRLAKAARRLQNVLGEHQDAINAEQLPLTEEARRELLALGRLMQSQQRCADEARERFPVTWRRFCKAAARFEASA